MRKGAWLVLLLLLSGGSAARAQVHPKPKAIRSLPRTLTAVESQAILDTVRDQDQQPDDQPDCSHLVHDVYELAGYPYPYARSIDLYAGIKNFARVPKPQPGDLIVWRGHVGIVVNPKEHSFYSSVSTGLQTEFYDELAWKKRGHARFYRYVMVRRPRIDVAGSRQAIETTNSDAVGSAAAADDVRENRSQATRADVNESPNSKSSSARTDSISSSAASETSAAPRN